MSSRREQSADSATSLANDDQIAWERFRRSVKELVAERDEVDRHLRLADAARLVVRRASRALSLEEALRDTGQELLGAFGLVGLWSRVFSTTSNTGIVLTVGDLNRTDDPEIFRVAQRAFPRLLQEKRAAVVGRTQLISTGHTDDISLVRDYLLEQGYESVLYTPLASGQEVFGSIAMLRSVGAPPWSEVEIASAFDIGRDLGRILQNVAAFERERNLADNLQQVDTFKSQLISTVSHELKNPLTALSSNLEMLSEPGLDEDQSARALSALGRSATRMAGIVAELKNISVDANDPAPLLEAVDLVPIARNVGGLIGTVVEQRDLVLDLRTPNKPVRVLGDAAELDRLLINLVSNAVKYTNEGGLITVTIDVQAPEAVIRVADTGIGISEDDQARLFEEFFRSHNPSALERPGTGLGLGIVDRIVKRHDGHIDLTSKLGEGSVFTVYLPLVAGEV